MSSSIVLKNPSWHISSSYDEIDSFPLMGSALPLAAITIAYLLFVLKIGPALMKNRKPFDIKNILLVYNAFQVGLSVFIVVESLKYHLKYGLLHSKCSTENKEMRSEVFYLYYLYFCAKVTELLDTIFFVLRKKSNQVSFLHVYHHAIMMVSTWTMFKLYPHDNLVFLGTANGLVHVFMYAYYGFAAIPSLTKYLWWKEYITTLQLIQFVAIFLHYQVSLFITECPPPKFVATFTTANNFLFVYLFAQFYIKSYIKNGGIKKPSKENNVRISNDNIKDKKIK